LPDYAISSLDGLTASQAGAAACTDGPVLVVAGPGSGKTRTLVARLAYLIESGLAQPEELLAVTFTRKAAFELKARLGTMLGPRGHGVVVGTFHSVALLLRPLPNGTLLLGEADRRALAQRVVSHVRATAGEAAGAQSNAASTAEKCADKLIDAISRLKGRSCGWQAELGTLSRPSWLGPAARAYVEWLQALGAEDLDDLLVAATQAVRQGTAQRRFRYIQVDEYQDVNGAQRELLCALAATGASIFAIGDPDQAIYGFRGAEVAHFHAFPSDFPGAQRFFLRDNFRATATLVSASTAVIAVNFGRQQDAGPSPRAARPGGEPLVYSAAPSAISEAIGVARQIERLIGGTSLLSHDQGRTPAWAAGRYGFSDIAVLTRTAARADRIAEALDREGVPILRPRRTRTAAATAEALWSQLLDTDELPLGARLLQLAAKLRELIDMPQSVGLEHEADEWDEHMQRVAVLTLHGAKGLEFPVVFLCGCEAELLPGNGADAESTAEERRLFYVGLTRAKDLLFLSHLNERPRSPFLDELPKELVSAPAPPKRKPRPPQLKLF